MGGTIIHPAPSRHRATATSGAWTLLQAIALDGHTRFVVLTRSLMTVALIASIAGVPAAVVPARHAAHIDILAAFATA
jgi:hypothetical protein